MISMFELSIFSVHLQTRPPRHALSTPAPHHPRMNKTPPPAAASSPATAACHVQTFSGRHFNVLEPRAADIRIEDAAHGLSMQCRFNGMTRLFYSVGDHSVRVADLLERRHPGHHDLAMWGLLHDVSEAYVGDCVRPVKRQLPAFAEIEDRIQHAVAEAFGLPWPMPREVHAADNDLLALEAKHLMSPGDWAEPPLDAGHFAPPRPPEEAKVAFLSAFHRLSAKRSH